MGAPVLTHTHTRTPPLPPPPPGARDAWGWDVGSGRAHVHAVCVLVLRGWFIGQQLRSVSGDSTYGNQGPLGGPAGQDTGLMICSSGRT